MFEQFRLDTYEKACTMVNLLNQQRELNGLDIPIELVVVMTKIDITSNAEVTNETAKKFCEENGIHKYFQCSSKQSTGNINEKIHKIVLAHLRENYPHLKLASSTRNIEYVYY